MKQQLPPNWIEQLVGVILLFSVGCSLFPVGYIVYDFQIRSYQPVLAYSGSFRANLTEVDPVVSEVLGNCNEIFIYGWSVNPAALLLLYLKNGQNETVEVFSFSHSLNASDSSSITLRPSISTYRIEAHRVANNTFFQCTVLAYAVYPISIAPPLEVFALWMVGIILILVGVYLTRRLIRLTREFM